jgi:hypothetical protein
VTFKPGDGRFKPGQSGNPGGRAKGVERIAREAVEGREYLARNGETYRGAAAMLHVLIDIATSPTAQDRDRREAANAVLDRGWGKPKQTIDVVEAQHAEASIDWSAVPEAERLELLKAAERIEQIAMLSDGTAVSADGDPTEH